LKSAFWRRQRSSWNRHNRRRFAELASALTAISHRRTYHPRQRGAQQCGLLSCLRNPAAKGGADNAGKRNDRQHGVEPPERERDGAACNAETAAKKGSGVDNA
jgi:hypothetical protein